MLRSEPTLKKPAAAKKPARKAVAKSANVAANSVSSGRQIDLALRDIRRRGKELTENINALLVRLG